MSKNDLKIYYQNIRGVNTKTHIRSNFSAADFEIIALTETWLKSDFSSSEIFDDSFEVFRSDRDLSLTGKKSGGGCLIAIKNNISALRMTDWEKEIPFENVWMAINQKKSNEKLYINVVYIAPKTSHATYALYFDHISNLICNVKPNSEFLFLGDFNIGTINEIIDKFAKITSPKNSKYPKWYKNLSIQLLTEKETYRDLYQRTNFTPFNDLYKMKRKLFKKERDRCEERYITDIENNINVNP